MARAVRQIAHAGFKRCVNARLFATGVARGAAETVHLKVQCTIVRDKHHRIYTVNNHCWERPVQKFDNVDVRVNANTLNSPVRR
jgi:hypothetical protein